MARANELKTKRNRVIPCHSDHTRITGSKYTSLILAQLLYWWKKMDETEFYKTDQELMEETESSNRQVKKAKKILTELGIVKIAIRGYPAKTYYSISQERLGELVWEPRIKELLEAAQAEEDDEEIEEPLIEVPESPHTTFTKVVETWNELADFVSVAKAFPNLFRDYEKDRIETNFHAMGEKKFDELLSIIKKSPFLWGENDKKWRADLSWCLKEENAHKIFLGRYLANKPRNAHRITQFADSTSSAHDRYAEKPFKGPSTQLSKGGSLSAGNVFNGSGITQSWGVTAHPGSPLYDQQVLGHIDRSEFKEARLKLFYKYGAPEYYSFFHLAKYELMLGKLRITPSGPIAAQRWENNYKLPLEYYP